MYRTWPKDLLAFRTQAFGVGRHTEIKGYRPGAGKERVDVVRKNERVCYFVQASDVHVHENSY